MKRTELHRKTPMRRAGKRRTEPKPHRHPDPEPGYWEQIGRTIYARSGGRCEGQATEECRRARGELNVLGMQRHHRKLRSQGGSHAVCNIAALCPWCHEWAHRHPEAARGLGLICPRFHDPACWALTLPGGRVVCLNSDGGYDDVMPAPDGEGAA